VSESARPASRPKVRRYLVTSLVLVLFSALSDLTLRLTNPEVRKELAGFSDRIGQSIDSLQPFGLAKTFYDRLLQSEYGWRPLSWSEPFNVTAATARFREEHPECSYLGQELLLFQRTPLPDLTGLSRWSPGTEVGSSGADLVLGVRPTPTPLPLSGLGSPLFSLTPVPNFQSRLSALLGTPTPGPFERADQEAGLVGHGTPPSDAYSGFLESLKGMAPTPTPTEDLAERMLREAGVPAGKGLGSGLGLGSTSLSLTQALCTEELRAEFQTIEDSSLGQRSSLLTALVGLPDALLHTVHQSFEGGAAKAIAAVLSILLGLGLLMALGVENPIALALLAPLAGSVAAWVLLLPVLLLNKLFGWAIAAVELLTVLASVPPVLWLLQVGFRMAETAAVDKALEEKHEEKKPEEKKP
jgi:hypothetical protein